METAKKEVKKKKKIKKIIIISSSIVVGLAVVLVSAFFIYVNIDVYGPTKEAREYLQDKNNVKYEDKGGYMAFFPSDQSKIKRGIIFYPGAKVQAESYAPLMNKYSALTDSFCALVRMPYNLAIFNENKAEEVLNKEKNITNWYMAGHSMGGMVAANYTNNHADKINGLILLGAYSTANLKSMPNNFKVELIKGDKDNILNQDAYKSNLGNLPSNKHENTIVGGNHSYFGMYGLQKGDNAATITVDDQMDQTVNYTNNYLFK